MKTVVRVRKTFTEFLSQVLPQLQPASGPQAQSVPLWKRVRGGLLFVLGYLLSPLSWWNDLIFNLPVAWLFGYLCHLVVRDWLLPGAIAGYWLSNVLGVLLMQFGALDSLQSQAQPRNWKKEVLVGLASSTVYTLVILGLVQYGILGDPLITTEQLANPGSWFSF